MLITKKSKLEPPEPLDATPNIIGREDIPGVTYEEKEMRELFFSVPIFYFDFKEHKQINKKLKKIILGWKDKEDSLQRSNVLGWHSKVKFPEEFDFISSNMINDVQKEIYLAEEYKYELKVDSMWAMVNKKYSYNKLHTHPGCHWAGVYYVQCPPKCGDIVFRFLEPRQSFPQPIFKKKY